MISRTRVHLGSLVVAACVSLTGPVGVPLLSSAAYAQTQDAAIASAMAAAIAAVNNGTYPSAAAQAGSRGAETGLPQDAASSPAARASGAWGAAGS